MLHRLKSIIFPRIELNRLRRELEEYKSKLDNRNGYIKELNETIRGYKSENTKLKNIIKLKKQEV